MERIGVKAICKNQMYSINLPDSVQELLSIVRFFVFGFGSTKLLVLQDWRAWSSDIFAVVEGYKSLPIARKVGKKWATYLTEMRSFNHIIAALELHREVGRGQSSPIESFIP